MSRVLRARADARSRRSCAARRWTNWWTCSSSSTTRCPSRLSTCPRSHRTPSRSVRSSSSRSWRNILVEVPTAVTFVPGNTLFNDRRGHEWVRVDGPTGVYFWNVSSNYTQWAPSGGIHRQPRAVYKYWATLTMHYKFQQSRRFTVEGTSDSFIDRVLDIAVLGWSSTCSLLCQRQGPGSDSGEKLLLRSCIPLTRWLTSLRAGRADSQVQAWRRQSSPTVAVTEKSVETPHVFLDKVVDMPVVWQQQVLSLASQLQFIDSYERPCDHA